MPLSLQDAVDKATMAAKQMPVTMADVPRGTLSDQQTQMAKNEWPSGVAIKPASSGGINPLVDPRAVAAYKAAMAPVDPHETLTTPIMAAPVKMARGGGSGVADSTQMSGGTMSDTGGAAAEPAPKMSPLDLIKEHETQKLMADYKKDADPYGSPDNHPGFFGKLLHGLSVATGGPGRREFEEQGGVTGRGKQVVGLEPRLEALAKQESEQNLQGAQAGDFGAKQKETEQNTALKPAEDASKEGLENAQAQDFQAQAAERQAAKDNPTLVVGHAHAVNEALKAGRDPATDPLVLQYEKAIQSTVPGFNKPTEAPKTISAIRPGQTKPHEYAWNPKTNAYDIDEGEHYERPVNVNVNAGEAALDRETKQFGAGHQKSIDAANAQIEKIDDARNMVNGNAESQALGIPKVLTALVSGQGSGVRITQPELNAIATARGLGGDIQGTLNSWSGQGKLTPTQQKQLTGILDDVKARLLKKQGIASEALDTINGASSRDEIIAADKTARQKLNDLEHGTQSAPLRPANVPPDYIYNENGPSGKGWYKPKAK